MTSTTTKPRRTVRTPAGVARLTLTINGTNYAVRPFPSPDGMVFALRKPDGEVYHVAPGIGASACNCGDYVWNREGRDPAGCKHVRALKAVGLIES